MGCEMTNYYDGPDPDSMSDEWQRQQDEETATIMTALAVAIVVAAVVFFGPDVFGWLVRL